MNLADKFTPAVLTKAIVALPKPSTVLGDSGLFKPKPVKTTTIIVESINGRLVLVDDTDRNSDPALKKNSKRVRRSFVIPHLPKEAVITPDELNVQAFGSDSTDTQAVDDVINDKLQGLKDDIEATKEFHRVGAITGKILDGDGATVLYNLFTEFGVTEKNENIAFTTETTDVRGKINAAKRYAKKQLGGVVIKGWKCYCSPEFFDALTAHPNVQKAYAGYVEAKERIGGDVSEGFTFAGVTFIEYDVEVTGTNGQAVKYIAANKARLVPVVDGLFMTYYAPANYNSAANTLGLEMYSSAEPRPHGKGYSLEAQSNPLSICTAPGALVQLSAT